MSRPCRLVIHAEKLSAHRSTENPSLHGEKFLSGFDASSCSPPPGHIMNEKQPIDFIVFAVRQAQEAQFFGFTRNEACRNLKIAIHQYWQNKTLGLHGQSQKTKIPRSKAAVGKPISEMIVMSRFHPEWLCSNCSVFPYCSPPCPRPSASKCR